MSWVTISIIAYFSSAVSTLIDKILLDKPNSHPAAYAFAVSIFGLVALLFVPFGFHFPGTLIFGVSMLAGIVFTLALLFFYTAVQEGEASRINPLIGGVSPIFVLILAWLIVQETLSLTQIAAFLVILGGSYFISRIGKKRDGILGKKMIIVSVAAGLFFALSHVLTKWVYVHDSFASGFVWRSIGSFVGAMILIAIPLYRREIIESFKRSKPKTGAVFISGQLFAAAGFILINYAFSLGSVALINALAGVQYVFLFFMIWPIAIKYPHLLEETTTRGAVRDKILGLIMIGAGIFLLFA